MYECRGFFFLKNPSSLSWPQSFWLLSDCSKLELHCHCHHTLGFLLRLCEPQQTSLQLLLSYLLVLGFDNKTLIGLWLTWTVKNINGQSRNAAIFKTSKQTWRGTFQVQSLVRSSLCLADLLTTVVLGKKRIRSILKMKPENQRIGPQMVQNG